MDYGFRSLGCAIKPISQNALESKSSTDTTLSLKSPATSSLHDFNYAGMRTRCDVGGAHGPRSASLALHLGHSSDSTDSCKRSSATVCTTSLANDNGGCSLDLNLNFQVHLRKEGAQCLKSASVTPSKALRIEPDLDLQLSLSSITSLTAGSIRHQSSLEPPGIISQPPTVPTASSCIDGSPLLWCVNTSEITTTKANLVQEPELSSTSTVKSNNQFACISGVITQQKQRNCSTKNCGFPGCVKGARGASGLCIAHGGGRRCQKARCHKGAEGKTIYCKAHGGGRRCEHLGCTKSAEGRTDFCIAHGGGRRCSHEGCTKAARGRSGLCIRHGGGKRCQKENCTKSAEGFSGLCIAHGGGRRCQYPECTKGAQGRTIFCKAHGGGKRCIYPDCNKGAEGSTPFCKGHGGGKRCTFPGGCTKSVHGGTPFCVAHGGGKRCAVPECTKSARGKTNFCVRHGGGKRCKSEGCGKSAQGSTDFCKAHGGGKRCSWGQPGSGLGVDGSPCDRFARGKIGLCAAHNALVFDVRVHGGAMLGPPPQKVDSKMKGVANDGDVIFGQDKLWSHSMLPPQNELASLPEGRVHGGSLMAMLASSSCVGFGIHSNNQVEGGSSERSFPHSARTQRWM